MAKKIRFPLQMKDGFSVRTLEELREHFDLESVLGYFADGKLNTWLTDRYYDELAQKVDGLSADTPDLNAKLCEIFGVEYSSDADDTDFEVLQRRNEKLRVLREVTDDQQILNSVDAVAFDQDELFDILDNAPNVIYLYGEKFSIPYSKSGITYIGVNNPEVILEKSGKEYHENEIVFQSVHNDDLWVDEPEISTFNWKIQDAEDMILEGKYQEAFPIIKRLAENSDARAMYHMARYYHEGYNTVQIDRSIRNEWLRRAAAYREPLSLRMYSYIVDDDEFEKIESETYENILALAQSGDAIAQCNLGTFFKNLFEEEEIKNTIKLFRTSAETGYALSQYWLGTVYEVCNVESYEKIIKLFEKAAAQGHAAAQYELGQIYHLKLEKDDIAIEWYRKAANQGHPEAMYKLGNEYKFGYRIKQDLAAAFELFMKAADQGVPLAMYQLSLMYESGYGVEKDSYKASEWKTKCDIAEKLDIQHKEGWM